MTKEKKLGIWMDHSTAQPIEYKGNTRMNVVESNFTRDSKSDSLGRSEHMMHNKEQHQQAEYFKKLGEAIRNYDEVILFGPTNAKAELHNILKTDHRFSHIKIDTKPADKMSYDHQHTFVQDYFSQN